MQDIFFKQKQIRTLEEKFLEFSEKSIRVFLKESIFAGLVLSLIIAVAGFFMKVEYNILVIASTIAVFFPLIGLAFFYYYSFESKKSRKELLVPDCLLQASMFPEKTDIVKIIKYLGKAEYGLLSKEFEKAHSEILKGTSVKQAFKNMKKRNNSRTIDRMCNLLIQGYESGTNMQNLFKEAADDLLETNSIIRERVSAMVIEKYTMLFAGGIIVPAVLGLIVGMIQGFNFSYFAGMDFGMSQNERKELLEAALLGNQVYIIEYALITSFFLALQEHDKKKAIVYAAFLLPMSIIAYNLAKGI